MTTKRIVACTDGSAFAEEAIPTAIALAELLDAELHAVTVLEEPLLRSLPAREYFVDTPGFSSFREAKQREAEAALERVVGTATSAGVHGTSSMRRGLAADRILEEAAACGADFIVLSTHGRTGVRAALLGSVANAVVHAAPCAVVLYRPR